MAYLNHFNPEKVDSVPAARQQFRFLKKAIDNGEIGSGGGGTGAVNSVNGKTGAVVLDATDVGAVSAEALQGVAADVATNTQDIATLQAAYAGLTQSDIVPLDTLPASGIANTIYRVAGTDSYTDYMWDGSDFVPMATYSGMFGEGVYDISAEHSGATYSSLTGALGENGANVPSAIRAGGMSVKFINSTNGKYEQWIYIRTDVSNIKTFTDSLNWKGVTTEQLLEERGGYFLATPVTEAASASSPKYVSYPYGGISNSSTATMTVAFYAIPTDVNVDKVRVIVPKTGKASTTVVSGAKTLSQTLVSVLSGSGNQGAYDGVVDIPKECSYVVVTYDSASGTPSLYFHVEDNEIVNKLYRDFSLSYGNAECTNYDKYINSNGQEVSHNNFQISDYLELFGATLIFVSYSSTTASSVIFAFYDSSKTYIENSSAKGENQSSTKYLVPSNAKYIRLSSSTSQTLSVVLHSAQLTGFLSYLDYKFHVKAKNEELSILHLGNSFTEDTHTYLNDIMTNIGINDVNVNAIIQSGSSLKSFADKIGTSSTFPITKTYGGMIAQVGTIEQIFSNKWDVIVFQQLSSSADDYSTFIPYLAKLIETARKYCTNKDVRFCFEVIWETTDSSYSDIINAAKTMVEMFGDVISIIPCGTALENVRNTSMADGANEFSSDAQYKHLAHGVGEYVAGCSFYCTLIQPFTKKSIYEDTTTTITTSGGLGEVDVTASNRALCQKCAEYADIYKYAMIDVENL